MTRARDLVLLAVLAGLVGLALGAGLARARPVAASTCANPPPEWLACEDFEGGGAGWASWFAASPFTECLGCSGGTNNPDRIRLERDPAAAHSGDWDLFLAAGEAAGYQGAALTFRSCEGQKREGCRLTGHEALYFRAWVKLAEDHQLVHHFLEIAGTRPDAYWESDGNAGCRPDGYRWAGTTLDFDRNHELWFYTYFPEMRCDRGNYCSGDYVRDLCASCAAKNMPCRTEPECCWGNSFRPPEPVVLQRGPWVCLELAMHLNTPGQADGTMAFWVDGEPALDQRGMHWRDTAGLQLNKAWLQHYIAAGDAQQSNQIRFDDVVVSTQRIGCGPPPEVPSPTPTEAPTQPLAATATATRGASTTPPPPSATPPLLRWFARLPWASNGH